MTNTGIFIVGGVCALIFGAVAVAGIVAVAGRVGNASLRAKHGRGVRSDGCRWSKRFPVLGPLQCAMCERSAQTATYDPATNMCEVCM